MILLAKAFTIIASLIHILFFLMESILWKNPTVYKIFQSTEEEAQVTSLLAFNQGFYNLFLAIGCLSGIFLLQKGQQSIGMTLIIFTLLCMFGASIILVFSSPKMIRGSILQGVPPLISLILYYLSMK